MKFSKTIMSGMALGASLVLVGTSALAATGVVYDPKGDAMVFTEYDHDFGEFDIDLTRIDIDHGTRSLEVTSHFTYLADDSWTLARAAIDTNGDGVEDYSALWSKEDGVSGVLDAFDRTTCNSIGTREIVGVNGTVSLNIPRTCIGSPAKVAVHVDMLWAGVDSTDYEDLYFVDSAPGEFADDRTIFSAPVASSNTGTATSPKPPAPAPAVKTSIVAKLSKKTHKSGTKPVKITASVKSNGAKPAGQVKIQLNGKVVKNAKVKAGKKVVHQLKRTMKPGRYKVKISFTPADSKRFKKSSKTVTLRVKR